MTNSELKNIKILKIIKDEITLVHKKVEFEVFLKQHDEAYHKKIVAAFPNFFKLFLVS